MRDVPRMIVEQPMTTAARELVENAIAQRDPHPASAERGRHDVLRAGGPGWPRARTSRRNYDWHLSPAPSRLPRRMAHVASFRCDAEIRSLSKGSGHARAWAIPRLPGVPDQMGGAPVHLTAISCRNTRLEARQMQD